VGMVVRNGETEFFTWDTPSSAPISIGKVNVNMASMSDGGSNFQVSGDVKTKAWITAAGPRSSAGLHYRIQVIDGKLATTYSTVETGYSSSDASGFQMISALNDSDQPSFVVGDTDGAAGAANSIKAYVNTFNGSTVSMMPG